MKKISEHFFYVSKHRNHLFFKSLIMINVAIIMCLIFNARTHSNEQLKDAVRNVISSVFAQEGPQAVIGDFKTFHQALQSYLDVRSSEL